MENSSIKRRLENAINASSMADIAFLLLIFFLVTTTILQDEGLVVQLPRYEEDIISAPIPDRNVLKILVNAQNQLLVEGKPLPTDRLRAATKEFILNPLKLETLSVSPRKALISLQNDRGTSYEMYLMVYNELKAAYRELWDEAAQRQFGKTYQELSGLQQRQIRQNIPLVISEAEPTNYENINQ
ncbi:MAG: ExbD/TolR family protein [Saprospiraceae bacterium]